MHYDNTYNRLKTLNEYIKDTEDLVNIKLDQHRNQLITTDLILTALTCSMAIVTTVSGIFGMNLDSGLQVSEVMDLAGWASRAHGVILPLQYRYTVLPYRYFVFRIDTQVYAGPIRA